MLKKVQAYRYFDFRPGVLSLAVPPVVGKIIGQLAASLAIVWPTGAEKTTSVNILMRFYEKHYNGQFASKSASEG